MSRWLNKYLWQQNEKIRERASAYPSETRAVWFVFEFRVKNIGRLLAMQWALW